MCVYNFILKCHKVIPFDIKTLLFRLDWIRCLLEEGDNIYLGFGVYFSFYLALRMSSLIILVSVVLIPSVLCHNVCPMNCFCQNKAVECMSLMEFPMTFPKDTTFIKLSQMNVRDIPPNAFSYMPDLEKIEFNNCNVQSLQGCSFAELTSIKEILLEKTVIENVQRYAFRDLSNLTSFEFNSCRIGRFKPFGFYNVTNVKLFTIYNTHFRNFYSQALYNVSNVEHMIVTRSNLSDIVTGAFNYMSDINKLEMHVNQFWNMQCNVMEDLMKASGTFVFIQNTFYCNCSVYWLVNQSGQEKYPKILQKNGCHGPDKFINQSRLLDVNPTALTCPGLNREPSCALVPITPNPRCPDFVDGVFENTDVVDDKSSPENFGPGLRLNFGVILTGILGLVFLINA